MLVIARENWKKLLLTTLKIKETSSLEFHVGGDKVRPQVLDIRGEALVEPEVVPPLHGDQVAEPLVGQLMRHHPRHTSPAP